MPRGNPTFTIEGIRKEPPEQIISYTVGIGYALQAIFAHSDLPPEVIAEALKIAEMTGAVKYLAQQLRDKELR
jgi:hypothetical protein